MHQPSVHAIPENLSPHSFERPLTPLPGTRWPHFTPRGTSLDLAVSVVEIYVLQGPRPLTAAWSALCSCLSSSSRGRSIERSEGAEGAKSAKGARREPLPPPPEEQEELEQQLQVAARAVIVPLPPVSSPSIHQ